MNDTEQPAAFEVRKLTGAALDVAGEAANFINPPLHVVDHEKPPKKPLGSSGIGDIALRPGRYDFDDKLPPQVEVMVAGIGAVGAKLEHLRRQASAS